MQSELEVQGQRCLQAYFLQASLLGYMMISSPCVLLLVLHPSVLVCVLVFSSYKDISCIS